MFQAVGIVAVVFAAVRRVRLAGAEKNFSDAHVLNNAFRQQSRSRPGADRRAIPTAGGQREVELKSSVFVLSEYSCSPMGRAPASGGASRSPGVNSTVTLWAPSARDQKPKQAIDAIRSLEYLPVLRSIH